MPSPRSELLCYPAPSTNRNRGRNCLRSDHTSRAQAQVESAFKAERLRATHRQDAGLLDSRPEKRCGRVPCGDRAAARPDQPGVAGLTPTPEQRLELAHLDDLLEQLDEVEHETRRAAKRITSCAPGSRSSWTRSRWPRIEPPVIASEDAGDSGGRSAESRQGQRRRDPLGHPVGLLVGSLLWWIIA